jgi:hypothetical protein
LHAYLKALFQGVTYVKYIYLMATALVASTPAFADTFAEERDFGDFAASGCKNNNGDFLIRGLVSSANEGTLVLTDPTNSANTTSVTLPGRGDGNREATTQKLSELRAGRTAVVVTMQCDGDGTPLARQISYVDQGGRNGAITF